MTRRIPRAEANEIAQKIHDALAADRRTADPPTIDPEVARIAEECLAAWRAACRETAHLRDDEGPDDETDPSTLNRTDEGSDDA